MPGLYKFQVYSLTKSNTKLFLELKLNNVVVATLWGYTVGDYAAAGNAVILQLEEGDTVWVQTRDDVAVDLYGTSEEIYTTFTGLQLSPLWKEEGTSVRSCGLAWFLAEVLKLFVAFLHNTKMRRLYSLCLTVGFWIGGGGGGTRNFLFVCTKH